MKFKIIDLTEPLRTDTKIFSDGEYSDPEFGITDWSSINDNGFRVSSLRLGTQTGTHIDAPAHFSIHGDCLEKISISELMGSYYLIDLARYAGNRDIKNLCSSYADENFLFIRAFESKTSTISDSSLRLLTGLPPLIWILDGEIEIAGKEKYCFNRLLAKAGKYLVESLYSSAASEVEPGGEIFIFPLRLEGTSGSPCRIAARVPLSC